MAVYECRRCEYRADEPWSETCPSCKGFYKCRKIGSDKEVKRVTAADAVNVTIKREPTGLEKFDDVLSGGLVKKFLTLFGGPKGSGKTTLMAQVLGSFSARHDCKVMFASAEEQQQFVLGVFKRVGVLDDRVQVMGCEEAHDVRAVIRRCKEDHVRLAVFDSLQRMSVGDQDASNRRDITVAQEINEHCKHSGMTAVLMSHMNKSLEMVGSTSVGHDVDIELEIHHYNEKDDGRARTLFTDETLGSVPFKDIRTLLVGKNRGGESGRKSFWQVTATGLVPLEQRPLLVRKETIDATGVPRASSLRLVTEEEVKFT